MNKIALNWVVRVVEGVMRLKAYRATKFVSDNQVVRATKRSMSASKVEIVLTIGRPNFAEREFIKSCKKSKENPVKQGVLLKFKKKK